MTARVLGRVNSNPPGYLIVGAPGGVAGLDGDGKLESVQAPDLANAYVGTPLLHSSATAALTDAADHSDITTLLEDVIGEWPTVEQSGWNASVDSPTIPIVNRARNAGATPIPPGRFTISSQINIPVDKCGSFIGWHRTATCLSTTGGFSDTYMFHIQADAGHTERPIEFHRMIVQGAGIGVDGNTRRYLRFADLTFNNTQAWAIEFLGQSIVGGEIARVFITECHGGIYNPFWQCDNWRIIGLYCARNTERELTWGSSGLHLDGADFETRSINHLDKPFIHIPSDTVHSASPGGDMKLLNVRTGNEQSTGTLPPRDQIVFGPLDDGVTPIETGSCYPITLEVYARGSAVSPLDPTSAVSVVRLRKPVQGMRLRGEAWDYKYIVDDGDIAADATATRNSKNNTIDMIYALDPPTGGLFKSGVGHGWRNAGRSPEAVRPGEGAVA